ncbi:MAG: ATP-binding protein [Chthoniobacteraceae bacterium]|nr:ATP-binding protein [Chthoniobacteraceae bacterium]
MLAGNSRKTNETLAETLRSHGYAARTAEQGHAVLRTVRHHAPDLILLDIDFPDMSGCEVCGQLKADPNLRDIPVLFLGGRHNTREDQLQAFSCGGQDFIARPFRFEEVRARIDAHLALHFQRRHLQEKFDKRCREDALRDSLFHMIIHDMRAPVTVVMGYMDLLRQTSRDRLGPEKIEWIQAAYQNSARINEMIQQLLEVNRLESGQMPITRAACNLREVVVAALKPFVETRPDRVFRLEAPPRIYGLCDRKVIHRVVTNLVENALKFTQQSGEIHVSVFPIGQEARLHISDNGPGIPVEHHQCIFEKFRQIDRNNTKEGAGLGLAFCKLAVEAHGGRIGLESEIGKGSTFWFTLPLTDEETAPGVWPLTNSRN